MATLFGTDNTATEVEPRDGKGFTLEELYELLGTDMVEVVRPRLNGTAIIILAAPDKPLGRDARPFELDGCIMIIDEEGKLKDRETNNIGTLLFLNEDRNRRPGAALPRRGVRLITRVDYGTYVLRIRVLKPEAEVEAEYVYTFQDFWREFTDAGKRGHAPAAYRPPTDEDAGIGKRLMGKYSRAELADLTRIFWSQYSRDLDKPGSGVMKYFSYLIPQIQKEL